MKRLLMIITMTFLLIILAVTGVLALASGAPGEDAYISFNEPDLPHNTETLMVAGNTAGMDPACIDSEITYLKWNLSAMPETVKVLTATLTFTSSFTFGTEGAELSLYATENVYSDTTTPWTEDDLTAGNAPAIALQFPLAVKDAPTNTGQEIVFETPELRDYINNRLTDDGFVSLALRFSHGCKILTVAALHSKENPSLGPNLQLVTEINAPDLVLDKIGPAKAYPGETITYTLIYTNVGNTLAHNALIADTLPVAVQVQDYTGPIIPPLTGNVLMWELFNLAPGDSGMFTITAIVNPTFTGLLTNTAMITSTTVESDTTNNVTPPVVTEVRAPDLAIHKSGPATASPGDLIEYTLIYTNVGDAPAPYVTITDLLPANTQLYDHSGTVRLPMPDDKLTWEVFDLAPDAHGTLTVSVVINATFTGWLTNTATIATSASEVWLNNNTSTTLTKVMPPPTTYHHIYLPLVLRTAP